MVGLLFPGQGSQVVGMGRDLAAAFPEARRAFEEADDVLGTALSRLMWEGPEEELTLTSNAQPALMTHSIAAYRVVADRLGDVTMAAGHSLGEFSAYVAADAMSFADGLRTVRRRGELMAVSGSERPGTMAALLGLDDEGVERVCAEASSAASVCVPANYNSPGQLVISGDIDAVERAMELARAAGAKRALRLNVSGAFHSPLMQVSRPGLARQLDEVAMEAPRFPVVSNVTARPVSDPGEARSLLLDQLTSPVRWTASMQAMVGAGIAQFYEIGSGNVLTGLLKRVDRAAACRAIGAPVDVEALGAGSAS
ncbi:MAG TPA: ACP S-malonyltransferase [Longimicrobiales bacterium]|nr:ACP S-malonyltransferase [Longimicrobiales bacterium]